MSTTICIADVVMLAVQQMLLRLLIYVNVSFTQHVLSAMLSCDKFGHTMSKSMSIVTNFVTIYIHLQNVFGAPFAGPCRVASSRAFHRIVEAIKGFAEAVMMALCVDVCVD
jgi:hypothetical protein